MKTSLKFLFFFLVLTQICFAQWFWKNPLPQGNDLRDVWVINENTIFAVGDRGTLLRSTNAGVDWEVIHKLADMTENIVDIQFVTDTKGWLLARTNYDSDWLGLSTKVVLTVDGGKSWNVIAVFDSLELNDLYFIDENTGWAVGSSGNALSDTITGMVFKTADGGYNWYCMYEQRTPQARQAFSSVHFIDADHGWMAGREYNNCASPDGELLRTTDGGLNWNEVNNSMNSIVNIQFLNLMDGWLIDHYWCYVEVYFVKKTSDGGLNWEIVFQNTSWSGPVYTPSLYFINDSCGWISENGQVHKTTDGGLTWLTDTIFYIPTGGSMHFKDNMNGCIVGKYGQILNTQDGGQSWLPRSTFVFDEDLQSIDFIDKNIGWVVGDEFVPTMEGGELDGKIFKTTDGGDTWIEQWNIPGGYGSFGITTVQAISDQTVYVAKGSIHKTTNGGVSWNQLSTIGDWGFNTLLFLDENTGFVGNPSDDPFNKPGRIYKTTNGGDSWVSVLTAPHSIQSIFFVNNSEGWAVGYDNPIYKTTDGGNTWHDITLNKEYLESVFFINSNIGWAVGCNQLWMTSEGIIIKTTNGGLDWDIVYTSHEHLFNSVFFNDSLKGFVTGYGLEGGVILSTTDGGINWISQFNNTPKGLHDIFFINDNTGWVVGEAGIILKTTNGGVVSVELNSFTITANSKEVTLNWTTATELNNQGFEVQRKFGTSDFVTIGSVKGKGTTTSPNHYSFVDKLIDGGKYFYRLKQIDYGGKYEYSQEVEVNWSPFTTYKLEQNFPNPLNPSTTIGFGIMEKGNVRLSVLNILGEEIKLLLNEEKELGYHSIDFNASDLPSGVYFYRIHTGNFIDTKKMLLLR